MLASAIAGALILLAPWIWSLRRVGRDWFLLLVTAQALIYAFIAPAWFASELDLSSQDAYGAVMLEIALAFGVPFGLAYARFRGPRDAAPAATLLRVSDHRLQLLSAGVIVAAVGYLWVALTRDLLFRRLGHTALAAAQLTLSVGEFAVYRMFIELGPWLVAVLLIAIRPAQGAGPAARTFARAAAGIGAAAFALHAIVNSRLTTLLAAAFLGGLFVDQLLQTALRRTGARLLVVVGATVMGWYALEVVQNVRANVGRGATALDPIVLVPGGATLSTQDDAASQRLNGVDLIVKIRPAVLAEGPAWGSAWAVPLVVSLDPIVRTDLTLRLKEAALTTSKSLLLLRYAGIAAEDYYNCMLSDAYGNLGIAGFALVGLVLGTIVAFGTRWTFEPRSGWQVIVGLFMLWRALPFEQEFGTVLYGWWKLAPFVVLVLLVAPFGGLASEHPTGDVAPAPAT